ncbi:glycosyltransferase family 2 protein [Priestia megaterium]|uniref:glycosyltransferase family 2 protein n=1 Tax=Priestia megaterium TaxID=1404 RepID=UPI001C8DAB8B|nr:glycosyltransferase family 2 protein [Priestia megaterium]MBY0196839.1 glycosyltransferase family 2 protein [Priestia megaterium]
MNGISVIVPIYNVEDYIAECLQSIVGSMKGFSNIQVILVDDGSQDSSKEIARTYIEEYSNFQYLIKENGGLSDARNYGLRYAKYDYVAFLDSDDYIDESYFLEIFKAMEGQPDMIIFDWEDVGDNGYTNFVKGIDFSESLWTVQPSAWNKVYQKNLFNKIEFPKGKIYEDVGTIYKLLYYVKEYTYVNKALYKYRKNRGGSILSTISPKINDIYEMLDEVYYFYTSNDALNDENIQGLSYQYIKLLMWSNMYRQLKYYKFDFVGFYKKMKKTRALIYNLFPQWKENPYIIENQGFFEKRIGSNYINRLDNIGKSLSNTALIIMLLIVKNKKRY